MAKPFLVNVAELLRRPAAQREVQLVGTAGPLKVVDASVPEGTAIEADVVLESMTDGIVVSGAVRASWEGLCRRCLAPVGGPLEVTVRELYRPRGGDDEAFSFTGEHLDLEPMVVEAVLLELPLAPLCSADCAGLCPVCGINLNEAACGHSTEVTDVRWAALDQLLDPGRLDHPEN